MRLQKVDQYDRECPEMAGGNGTEHDGREWDARTTKGQLFNVQSSQKDSQDDARCSKLRVEN